MRNDAVPAAAAAPAARMSIARRPLLDLPMAASGGGPAMAVPGSSSSGASIPSTGSATVAANTGDSDASRQVETIVDASADPDFDLSSAFDVPAFLRRQEG
jgi:hypothetical protein